MEIISVIYWCFICLVLYSRQYQHKQNLRAHRYATTTNVQNLSLITLMRRISSFHGFFLSDLYAPVGRWDLHGLSLAWYCVPDWLVVLWFNCIEGRFGWKPIPSAARVTRDGVSGLPIMKGELSGRQYLPPSEASVESVKSVFDLYLSGFSNTDSTDWHGCLLRSWYCLPDSFFLLFL